MAATLDRVELESETYSYKKTIVLVLFFYQKHKNELSLEGAMNNEYRYTICTLVLGYLYSLICTEEF